ncbi:hypothetical protein [Pseudonocardia parietis]|uniref:Uncharacterized protein n=1 Tax=Pseudonocardia parietis TaxID=570936 RepID=A0ABS4W653_9PSEU|nr:hypothetical protein [Pseudonocardia parietis]MBP2371686.1 hypothetical protein [Pseudonocardia parietis]
MRAAPPSPSGCGWSGCGDLALRAGEPVGCFTDPWDAGQAGLAYLTRGELRAACGGIYPGDEQAEALLGAEVATYDQWARGEVVGYIAEQWTPCPAGAACAHPCGGSWEEIASCWGISGIGDAIAQGSAAIAA